MLKSKLHIALAMLREFEKQINGGVSTTLYKIAEDIGISMSYAEQIATVLTANDLITGKRGPNGGTRLVLSNDGCPAYRTVLLTEFDAMFHPDNAKIRKAYHTNFLCTPLEEI